MVKIISPEDKTVIMEYSDGTVENVSGSRVVLAPDLKSPEEISNINRPMTYRKLAATPLIPDGGYSLRFKRDEAEKPATKKIQALRTSPKTQENPE